MADRSVSVDVTANVSGFVSAMRTAERATRDFARRSDQYVQRHSQAMTGVGQAAMGAGVAILAGVGLAVKAFADFDEQMSKVQAATHASAGVMDQFREAAVAAGADTSFSAKEAGQAIEELSKAGVGASDILNGGLAGALSLASAGSLEVADAAELAATAMVQFKLSGQEIPHVADLLAAGAGKAQGSVEDIGMALKQGGLVASSFGLSIEETVGSLAAFASAGLLGSDAGTALKTSLLMLANPSKESAAKMAELGIKAYDANGQFVGMAKLAGNLKGSLGDLTQEQRNQALATIFGSDAIRVANILFEQGSEGIDKWTKAVNDAGYAALTSAMQSDNLKGDLERLTGSLDSVFLKSASGANDALRGLVQGAEDLVDAIGSIPGPILNLGLGLAGISGGALLVGGAFLSAAPRVFETVRGFQELTTASPRTASALATTGKVAGVAVAALAGLMIMEAVTDQFRKAAPKIDRFNSALLDISPKSLDPEFQGLIAGVDGVGDALVRVSRDGFDGFSDDVGRAISAVPGLRQNIADMDAAVSGLDQSLAGVTGNGGLPKAAEAFNLVAAEAEKSAKAQGQVGFSTQQVLDKMPEYKAALQEQARQFGDSATEAELLEMAQGRIPQRLQDIAAATGATSEVQRISRGVSEEQAEALADLGLNADGTTASFYKLLDAMFATGVASMSARAAEAAWQAELDGLQKKIDEVTASQAAGNQVWDAAKGSFDLTSEAGRAANEVFGGMEERARAATQALANNGAEQPELQAKLTETYNKLYDTAFQFGKNEQAADRMARAALGIPDDVDINTAIQNYADSMAKIHGVQQAANNLNGTTSNVRINVSELIRTYRTEEGSRGLDAAQNGASGLPANGGLVPEYLAAGGIAKVFGRMRPIGTDTIPAMLTPGEFVLRRSAAEELGYQNLFVANKTGQWPGGGSGQTGDIYVNATFQNPFTGEQVRAVVRAEAAAVVDEGFRDASMRRRG